MKRFSVATMLALRLIAAGAQESSPEQLIDGFIASGDHALVERIQTAIDALPRGYRSRLLGARLLLRSGRANEALNQAAELNRDIPDELEPYGLIVEAAVQLGDVQRAEEAGQWMLKLRPDDMRSLLAAATVRETINDLGGSEEMLIAALARTTRQETARRAAIGVSLARVKARRGSKAEAVSVLDQIDKLLPAYAPASALRKRLEEKK